jgi:hypothetical protein
LETLGSVQTSAIHPAAISATVTPQGIPEPLLLPPRTQRLTGHSCNGHTCLVSGIRRARKNHIRRIAAGATADIKSRAAEAEKQVAKIKVDERYAVTVLFSCPASGRKSCHNSNYRHVTENDCSVMWPIFGGMQFSVVHPAWRFFLTPGRICRLSPTISDMCVMSFRQFQLFVRIYIDKRKRHAWGLSDVSKVR